MAVETSPAQTPARPPEPNRPQPSTRQRAVEWVRDLRLTRWNAVGLVAALIVVSGLLRTEALAFHYWVDEGISVGISSHPLRQLPALLREDGSPPLYYLLLHIWMQLWGRGEVATHALSLIFALVTVPVAYWGGASLFNRRAGLYCALLTAAVPFLTAYAQETRMYSLMLLLSLIVAASFVHLFVFRRRRYLPLFVVSLTAALYTHNWALFMALMTFVTFLVCARVVPLDRRGLIRDGAIAFGGVAVLYLPWVPTLLYQARHTGAPWSLGPVIWSLSQGLYFIVGGRGAAVALLLAAGSGLLALRYTERRWAPLPLAAVALILLGVGTLLVGWVEAKLTAAWALRYLAVIVGPMILLVGLGLARASRLGLAALFLVGCFWVLDPLPASRDTKSNVAAAARVVRTQTGVDALVLSTQPEQVPTLAFYLPRAAHFATPLGLVRDPRVVDWRNALGRFRHSSVQSVLAPLIQSLTPGERVALVVPTRLPKTPTWMKLIHRSTLQWTRYLEHDSRLKLLKVTSPHAGVSGLPVQISLYVEQY